MSLIQTPDRAWFLRFNGAQRLPELFESVKQFQEILFDSAEVVMSTRQGSNATQRNGALHSKGDHSMSLRRIGYPKQLFPYFGNRPSFNETVSENFN